MGMVRHEQPLFVGCPSQSTVGWRHAIRGRAVCTQNKSFTSRRQALAPRPHTTPRRGRLAIVTCFQGKGDGRGGGEGRGDNDGDDGDDGNGAFDPNEDENDGFECVTLTDPNTGRTLPCVIEHEVEVGSERYCVCCPTDDVVAFATEDNTMGIVCIEDPDMINSLFPTAAAVLSEDHITLKRTAFVLTMDDTDARLIQDGDLDADDDDEDDDIEEAVGARISRGYEAEDRAALEEDEDDEESSLASILGEFRHGGKDFFVVSPEEPVHLLARRTSGGLVVPEEEELLEVTPKVEAVLESLPEIQAID